MCFARVYVFKDKQGRRKDFFKGGRFVCYFSKGLFFALISSLTLYVGNV